MRHDEDLILQTNELLAAATIHDVMEDHHHEVPVPGTMDVDISADAMSAWLTLFPPRGGAEPITPGEVMDTLERAGVVFGIDEERISEAVFSCNTEHRTVYSVEVARGEAPRDAVPEHIAVVWEPEEHHPEERGGRVDFRNWAHIPVVPADSVLARTVPASSGSTGLTVTGEDVPFRTVAAPSLTAGENTVFRDGEIVSAVDGVFVLNDGMISISPLLEIRGDVDYGTGNIDFNGDVLLHGRVAATFTVTCSGNLRAMQTLDAYAISCGSLEVKQGIIGHNDSTVTVAGPVLARFLQNVKIHSETKIMVGNSVLSSHLTARETILMGRNSTVIGSVLRASEGVEAYNIGSPGSAVTELYLGIDFAVDHRLAEIRDNSLALGKQLAKVQAALQRAEGNDERLTELERKLKEALAVLGQEAGELVNKLDRNENAEVIVHGTVYTGTYIEICHRSFHADRDLSACRIFLDRRLGTVRVEPLAERSSR